MRETVVETAHRVRPAAPSTAAADAGDRRMAATTGLTAVAAVPSRTEKKKDAYRATLAQKSVCVVLCEGWLRGREGQREAKRPRAPSTHKSPALSSHTHPPKLTDSATSPRLGPPC